jgi:hypothetical protein
VKRNVPLAITALVGFVLMLAPFIPYITTLNDTALLWFDVIGGFGAILGAASLLRRNLLIYGVGGIIAPFPGIWLIDRLLVLLRLA